MISLLVLFLPLSTSLPLLGWVESPGYPRGYLNEDKLEWNRCAPPGHTLYLTLTHLDLEDSDECEHDALEIFRDEIKLVSLCGRKSHEELQSSVNPSLQSSTSGCLRLSFHSDYSNTRRHSGFRAFYTVQDVDECVDPDNACNQYCANYIGGYRCFCWPGYSLVKGDEHSCTVNCSMDLSGSALGTVSSPGRPGPYPEHALCTFTLAVDDHLQLVLEFTGAFDVEEAEGGQCVDSVTIKTPSREFGPFCGSVPPSSPLLTNSHQVEILFSSDVAGTNTGFTLKYTTTAKTCPNKVTPNSSASPQMSQYRQGDEITVLCDPGHFPTAGHNDDVNYQDYRSVCQSTGVWNPVFPCDPVECDLTEIPEGGLLKRLGQKDKILYQDEVQFQCESKYHTLEPNETYSCDDEGNWRSVSGQTTLPKCVSVCGKREHEVYSYSRIYGGEPAISGQIPWQLWLEPCNGSASLINDRWALTAAHVVERHDASRIHIYGDLFSRTDLVCEKIIYHPEYKTDISKDTRLSYDHDIALIKLASRAKLDHTLLPICLPEKKEGSMEGKVGTVSGWGATEKNSFTRSTNLLYANIIGYSRDNCFDVPMNLYNKKKMIYTKNMFCAGESGKDSCQGDSGGPFVYPRLDLGNRDGQGPYRLYGLVSWGGACKDKGYYTKVGNYVDWIKKTIEEEESAE